MGKVTSADPWPGAAFDGRSNAGTQIVQIAGVMCDLRPWLCSRTSQRHGEMVQVCSIRPARLPWRWGRARVGIDPVRPTA